MAEHRTDNFFQNLAGKRITEPELNLAAQLSQWNEAPAPVQMFKRAIHQRHVDAVVIVVVIARGKVLANFRVIKELVASLHIDYLKIRQHFTTRNYNHDDYTIDMTLVDGPFEQLSGGWRFIPLGDIGCKIEFRLNYEFSSKILEKIIGPVFSHISGTLVDCFIREADRLYGDD